MNDFKSNYELVLEEINEALSNVDSNEVDKLIDAIINSQKIFVVGVGRVLISLNAFVKRVNHLSIPCYYVGQIDEPAFTKDDLLIVASGSGESLFPLSIAKKAKEIGATICHIGSNPKSSMENIVDFMVRIPVSTKLNLNDEIKSIQIMSSLFEQSLYILLDTICLIIAKKREINLSELWMYHANLE